MAVSGVRNVCRYCFNANTILLRIPQTRSLNCRSLHSTLSDWKGLPKYAFSNSILRTFSSEVKGDISDSQLYSSPSKHSDKEENEKKEKTRDFSRRAMKYAFIAFGSVFTGVATFLIYEWGAPARDENGNIIQDEFTGLPWWKACVLRTHKELLYYAKVIKEPSREKLLPDPLTDPYYQPPYTLVLEMTGILVHPDWTYQTGWRFKKRPGIEFFLQQVGPPLYEVVVYTSEQGFTAFPLLESLDPHGYITYRLFRDATRYLNGHHVKDLSCLNRDLSKVIFVDWDLKSFQLQPDNALKIKKWNGQDEDRSLVDLAVFLKTIAVSGVEDVRSVLDYYRSFDDPIEAFKENQRRLQEKQEKAQKEKQETKSSLVTSIRKGLFGR